MSRASVFVLLAACSYTPPGSVAPDGPGTTPDDDASSSGGDGPGDVPPPQGETVRAIDLVDGQVTGGPHTDFPLLVSLTEPYLRDAANGGDVVRADGFDIYFSGDPEGTMRLSHEVERYDAGKGVLIAWVKVPALTASTVIYLRYGSTTITTSQEDVAAVWSAGYVAVLHLDGATDASGHATQVTMQTTANVETPMDRGHTFDGDDDRVIVASQTIDNIFATGGTAEGWFFADTYGENGFGRLWDKGNGSGWSLSLDDNNATQALVFVHGDAVDTAEWHAPNNSVSLNSWHHTAIVYDKRSDANDPLIYIDGVQQVGIIEFDQPTAPMDDDAAAQLMVANRGAGDRTFDGTLDELRLSNVVRSPEWIATGFANQVAPASFYVVGDPL